MYKRKYFLGGIVPLALQGLGMGLTFANQNKLANEEKRRQDELDRQEGFMRMNQMNDITHELNDMNENYSFYPARNGMKVPGANVELEKEEVIKEPDGSVKKFNLPTHENATDKNRMYLPQGTMVFSDTLRLGDKTFAEIADNIRMKQENASKDAERGDLISAKGAKIMRESFEDELNKLFAMQEDMKGVDIPGEEMSSGGIIRDAWDWITGLFSGNKEAEMTDYKLQPIEPGDADKLEYPLMSKVVSERNKDKDWVDRGLHPEGRPYIQNDDGSRSTHLLSYSDTNNGAMVYPTIVRSGENSLKKLSPEEAEKYAIENKTAIEFPSRDFARYYSENGLIDHKNSITETEGEEEGVIEKQKDSEEFDSKGLLPYMQFIPKAINAFGKTTSPKFQRLQRMPYKPLNNDQEIRDIKKSSATAKDAIISNTKYAPVARANIAQIHAGEKDAIGKSYANLDRLNTEREFVTDRINQQADMFNITNNKEEEIMKEKANANQRYAIDNLFGEVGDTMLKQQFEEALMNRDKTSITLIVDAMARAGVVKEDIAKLLKQTGAFSDEEVDEMIKN